MPKVSAKTARRAIAMMLALVLAVPAGFLCIDAHGEADQESARDLAAWISAGCDNTCDDVSSASHQDHHANCGCPCHAADWAIVAPRIAQVARNSAAMMCPVVTDPYRDDPRFDIFQPPRTSA